MCDISHRFSAGREDRPLAYHIRLTKIDKFICPDKVFVNSMQCIGYCYVTHFEIEMMTCHQYGLLIIQKNETASIDHRQTVKNRSAFNPKHHNYQKMGSPIQQHLANH